MKNIHIGCVPITWSMFPDKSQSWTEEEILAEMAQAGYAGIHGGPKAGRTPAETITLYKKYGLKPAPGYLGAEFWLADKYDEIMEKAKTLAEFHQAVGLSEVFVAAQGGNYVAKNGKNRRELAGHVGPEDGLTAGEYQQFAQTLNAVGEATLTYGVKACFHNHVGTVIETREELDTLFDLLDPSLVFLGPDTGHLAWGGGDVLALCRDYGPRIKSMHLKDINPAVLAEGQKKEWAYGDFTANGIFAELGEGFIDFPAMLEILQGLGFEGWLMAETDVTTKASPLESVTISRNYLKSLGL